MTELTDLIIQAQDIGSRLEGQSLEQPIESFAQELQTCMLDLDTLWRDLIASGAKEAANDKSSDCT